MIEPSASSNGVFVHNLSASDSQTTTVSTAVAIAIIGAAATVLVGTLNLLSQIRNFKWQKQQQRDQYVQASHQLDLLNSAQLTERFSRAVEQLGSTTPAIRIGGIYALERVARDSLVDRAN